MNEDEIPQEFWTRTDEFIALANQQAKNSTTGEVSASLLYAAARFNSFNVASMAADPEQMRSQREDAIHHFTEQYRNMLEVNLDEYIANFDAYKSSSS